MLERAGGSWDAGVMSRIQKLAFGSIVVGAVVLALKYAAYLLTGSLALWSDAVESVVNVLTAVVSFLAVRLSAKPPDAGHPYGHQKVEYFSAVFCGVLIIIAAVTILHEAYQAFRIPAVPALSWTGLAVNALASAVNAGWACLLIREGREQKSPALAADGRHLLTDLVSSLGVLVGVGLAGTTGWPLLDPALAVVVALHILWAGWSVMRESLGGLMDEAVPPETLSRIRELIATNAEGAIEAHDLRTRHAGRMMFIDFHLVVASDMTVTQAHDICDRLERAIKHEYPDALISVHVEPDDKAKHAGIVVL